MRNHKIQHQFPRKNQAILTWKEPVRRRSLQWVLRTSFHPIGLSSNLSLHPGLLGVMLFLLGGVVVMLSGDSLPTVVLLLLCLVSGPLIGLATLLPRIFSSAQISIHAGQLLRECCGHKERWDHAEMCDLKIWKTHRNGERRELLWFRDSQGQEETILLPWRLESGKVKKVLAATNNKAA